MFIIDIIVDVFIVEVIFSLVDFFVCWNFYDGSWNEFDILQVFFGELCDYGFIGNYIFKYYFIGYNVYLDFLYIFIGIVIIFFFDGGLFDGGVGVSYDIINFLFGVVLMYYDENFKKIGFIVYKYIDSIFVYFFNGIFFLDKLDGVVYFCIDNLWCDF